MAVFQNVDLVMMKYLPELEVGIEQQEHLKFLLVKAEELWRSSKISFSFINLWSSSTHEALITKNLANFKACIEDIKSFHDYVGSVLLAPWFVVSILPPPVRLDFLFYSIVFNLILIRCSIQLDFILSPYTFHPRRFCYHRNDKVHLTKEGSRNNILGHRNLQKKVYDLYHRSPLMCKQNCTLYLFHNFEPNECQGSDASKNVYGCRMHINSVFDEKHFCDTSSQHKLGIMPVTRPTNPFALITSDSLFRDSISNDFREQIKVRISRYGSVLAVRPGGDFKRMLDALKTSPKLQGLEGCLKVIYSHLGTNYVWTWVKNSAQSNEMCIPDSHFLDE